jgi:hypothetical protein
MPHKPSQPEDRDATGHRNPGIDKQRETVAYWKRRALALQPLEDAHVALSIPGVVEYLSALGALHHVAHYGVNRTGVYGQRPNENGTTKVSWQSEGEAQVARRPVGESKPPTYDAYAIGLLRAEERRCKKWAGELTSKLDTIVDQRDAA